MVGLLALMFLAMPYGAGVVSLVVIAMVAFMVFMGVGMFRKRDGSQHFKAKAGSLAVESKSAADKQSLPKGGNPV